MHFGFWCWVDNNSLTNTIYQKKKKKKKKSVHCMQCTMHPKWQCECDTQLVFSLCAPNNLLDQTEVKQKVQKNKTKPLTAVCYYTVADMLFLLSVCWVPHCHSTCFHIYMVRLFLLRYRFIVTEAICFWVYLFLSAQFLVIHRHMHLLHFLVFYG